MLFQILPDRPGQVCRRISDLKPNPSATYILTDNSNSSISSEMVELVSISELQRNSKNPLLAARVFARQDDLTVVADNLEKYVSSWNESIKVPYSLKVYVISNLDDVKHFLRDIHSIYANEFHPDDDFENFKDEYEKTVFTNEEAVYLNNIMTNCFNVSETEGADIYDISGQIQIEIWKQKGIWP
jgi:hypothetical protein